MTTMNLERIENDKHSFAIEYGKEDLDKPSLLLHSCCGPCSTAVMERLVERFRVTLYFYNPNITDREEYEKRRKSQILAVKEFNKKSTAGQVSYIEGPYDVENFYQAAKGLEEEKEGGARCTQCFFLRLENTAKLAKEERYDYFATTLTVSPHKNFKLIGSIGESLANKYKVSFLNEDFKKKAGFQRSIELSKEFDLYRQNYCGCEFSIWWND